MYNDESYWELKLQNDILKKENSKLRSAMQHCDQCSFSLCGYEDWSESCDGERG